MRFSEQNNGLGGLSILQSLPAKFVHDTSFECGVQSDFPDAFRTGFSAIENDWNQNRCRTNNSALCALQDAERQREVILDYFIPLSSKGRTENFHFSNRISTIRGGTNYFFADLSFNSRTAGF